jgi:PleD family two-component response regulator
MNFFHKTSNPNENYVEFREALNSMANDPLYTAKILIVDDDSSSFRQLSRILVNAGYQNIISASDPKEALKLFSEKQPDLTFLGLSMKCLEDDAILDEFKACYEKPTLPIIVLANQSDLKTRLMAHKWGLREFLGQPYSSNEVCFRVNYVLKKA